MTVPNDFGVFYGLLWLTALRFEYLRKTLYGETCAFEFLYMDSSPKNFL